MEQAVTVRHALSYGQWTDIREPRRGPGERGGQAKRRFPREVHLCPSASVLNPKILTILSPLNHAQAVPLRSRSRCKFENSLHIFFFYLKYFSSECIFEKPLHALYN